MCNSQPEDLPGRLNSADGRKDIEFKPTTRTAGYGLDSNDSASSDQGEALLGGLKPLGFVCPAKCRGVGACRDYFAGFATRFACLGYLLRLQGLARSSSGALCHFGDTSAAKFGA
jgi:hypothetical protein